MKMIGGWRSAATRLRIRCEVALTALFIAGTAISGLASEATMDNSGPIQAIVSEGKTRDILSFLPPGQAMKRGIDGPAIVGTLRVPVSKGGTVTPDNVGVNPAFVKFLQAFIARVAPTSPEFIRSVEEQGEGWLYIIDQRTPTPGGNVPLEDILGAFRIEHGKAVPGSYQPMDGHKIVSERGLFQLDTFLQARLVQELTLLNNAGQ